MPQAHLTDRPRAGAGAELLNARPLFGVVLGVLRDKFLLVRGDLVHQAKQDRNRTRHQNSAVLLPSWLTSASAASCPTKDRPTPASAPATSSAEPPTSATKPAAAATRPSLRISTPSLPAPSPQSPRTASPQSPPFARPSSPPRPRSRVRPASLTPSSAIGAVVPPAGPPTLPTNSSATASMSTSTSSAATTPPNSPPGWKT